MARADFEKAKELYPSCDMGIEGWLSFFGTRAGEHSIGKMLYDIYDEVKAQEERDLGTHKMGRRPKRDAVPLEELMSVVMPPTYTNEAFPDALRRLLDGRSQAAFARRIPVSQPYLSRLLSGEYKPDIDLLQRIAEAAKVRPWFFAEWRALYLGELVTRTLLAKPNMSITALQDIRNTRRHEEAV